MLTYGEIGIDLISISDNYYLSKYRILISPIVANIAVVYLYIFISEIRSRSAVTLIANYDIGFTYIPVAAEKIVLPATGAMSEVNDNMGLRIVPAFIKQREA